MSSNIRLQKICQHCGQEFTARTLVTKYCGDLCAKRAYKVRMRSATIQQIESDTKRYASKPIETIKAKEFLTVRDVATLLNCSVRTAYRIIGMGNIKAVNIAQRKTLVKRSDIDKLFETNLPPAPAPEKETVSEPVNYELSECYLIAEIITKYGISDSTVRGMIKKNNVPVIRKGWYAYVPKTVIDRLLS